MQPVIVKLCLGQRRQWQCYGLAPDIIAGPEAAFDFFGDSKSPQGMRSSNRSQ
jgi:hypothetical protein